MASATVSISSELVRQLQLIRRHSLAVCGESPISKRTWLGLMEPEEQAEPAETQIPSRSRALSRTSAGIPWKRRFEVLGRRGVSIPVTLISPTVETFFSNESRNEARSASCAEVGRSLQAPEKPAIPSVFWVPP